jgi:predicted RNA polymerase sigma factor
MLPVEEGDAVAQITADAVARRSYGKLVAFLAARTHDVAAAEDALSEAFASALAEWPKNGCPDNPEAWLLTVARRKAIDGMRRLQREDGDAELLNFAAASDLDTGEEIPDRRLALMFACAHPAIDVAIRAPLMLQVILGLDAQAIACAFLTSHAAMGKRLVRAKEKIRQAGIPLRVPEREDLPGRLDAVLEAIYAAFAEGWGDPAGTDAVRRELTGEARFLAGVVVELLPNEPEALGLMALMLHSEARRNARRTAEGDYVPLAQQRTELWDWGMIGQAETLLLRASSLRKIGRYQVEAAIQSAHVERRRTGQANWAAVLALYDALIAIIGSPVAAVNRALVVAEIDGPAAALAAMPSADEDARLAGYQPYWAARAELLLRAGSLDEARHALEIAIGMAGDPAVRRFLELRRAEFSG